MKKYNKLKAEFDDLVNSDSDFNYNENEFVKWLKDCDLYDKDEYRIFAVLGGEE